MNTERYPSEHELYLATHDELTGLLNPHGWNAVIESKRADIELGKPFAFAALDVDGLKAVNDKYGHSRGNALIEYLAIVIRQSIRNTDSAAGRIGGDEFLVLFDMRRQDNSELSMQDRVNEAVDRIRCNYNTRISAQSDLRRLRVGVSIGAAIAQKGVAVEDLIDSADKAARQDKLDRLPPLSLIGKAKLRTASWLLKGTGVRTRELGHYQARYGIREN